MNKKAISIFYALMAAGFYGISVPFAKLLLNILPPVFIAALLYLGAGMGMAVINLLQNRRAGEKESRLTKKELPYTAVMVVLDIAAPIFLMVGLSMTTSATASLLGNFEIVTTTGIALLFFKESVGKRIWLAVALITVASMILSVGDFSSLEISIGAVFVLLGCACWGIENNCTRMLSLKNPIQIVVIKGICSGLGSLSIAVFTESIPLDVVYIVLTIVLGFVAYGLSIYFYILAQRSLGAVRTSAFYAFAPFIGTGLSLIIFKDTPTLSFVIALVVMAVGAYLVAFEKHNHEHAHTQLEHDHRHNHSDGHHNHIHNPQITGEHSHLHTHEPLVHMHKHSPDLHHPHTH